MNGIETGPIRLEIKLRERSFRALDPEANRLADVNRAATAKGDHRVATILAEA
jgi:hypothetical protein